MTLEQALARIAVLEGVVTGLLGEFEAAIHHHENKGKGGQHVSFHGDFASIAPSVVGRLRWWARELRAALGAPTEAPCPDCVEDVCSRCYMETVNTPATVPPGLCSCFHAPEQHAFLGCTRCLCKWGGQLPKDGEP